MLDHIGIFVSDTHRSFPFFEAALAPLGIVVRERQRHWGSIIMSAFLVMAPERAWPIGFTIVLCSIKTEA